jgi:shikimate kinase
VGQQLARTRRNRSRPLLNTPDPRETLERLMQQRAPLYDETADLIVDTDGRRVGAVVEEIDRRLAEARGT